MPWKTDRAVPEFRPLRFAAQTNLQQQRSNCRKYAPNLFGTGSLRIPLSLDFLTSPFTLIVSKMRVAAMKGSGRLAVMAILAAVAVPAIAAAQDAPAPRHAIAAVNVTRDAVDGRAVHLARAALEGQQVQEFSREELVSLLVLMSLPQSPRQHS
jgi:hypothetical protein